MKIEISNANKENLEDFRKELCGILSQLNDIELMKAVEKASEDSLITLLNFGFDERFMFDTLNGKAERGIANFDLTKQGKTVLLKVLTED